MIHLQWYYKNSLVHVESVELPFNTKNCTLIAERIAELATFGDYFLELLLNSEFDN